MITFPPGTEAEVAEWMRAIEQITAALRLSLSCELHEGYPCNMDRWAMVDDMAHFLRIHGYTVIEPPKA